MATETTIRRALLQRLEKLDPTVAEHLATDIDADLIERRREALSPTPTTWQHWIGILAFTLSLTMLVAPVVSDVDPALCLAGFAVYAVLMVGVTRWQRKKDLYDLLAIVENSDAEGDQEAASKTGVA
jgi:uncharacterized membrane protein